MATDIAKLAPSLPTKKMKEALPKVSYDIKDAMQAERKRLGLSWEDYFRMKVGKSSPSTPSAPSQTNEISSLHPDLNVAGVPVSPLLLSQETKEEFTKEYYEMLKDQIGLRRKQIQEEIEEQFGSEGGSMSKALEKVIEYQALSKALESMGKSEKSKEGDKKMDASDMMLLMMLMNNQQRAPPQQQQTMDPMTMMMFMQMMQKEPPKDDKMSNFLMQYMQNEISGQREANKQLLAEMMQQKREEKLASDQKMLLDQQAQIFQAFKDEVAQQFANFTQQQQQQLELVRRQNDLEESLRKTLSIIDQIKEFEEHAKEIGISKGLSSEESQKAVAEATAGRNDLLLNIIQKGLEYISKQTASKPVPAPVPPVAQSSPTPPPPKPEVEAKPPPPIKFIEKKKE